jgi:hypothetical protein
MESSNLYENKHAARRHAPSRTIFEVGHADIPLSEWEAFRDAPPRDLIEKVIDRSETELPDYCVPLARGVAMASGTLLERAGYRPGRSRPRRWFSLRANCSRGWDGAAFVGEDGGGLYTRRYGDLWSVEWATQGMLPQILVVRLGSTPIVTRTCDGAMLLGELCLSAPPEGLCWVSVSGRNCGEHLIELAKARTANEAAVGCNPSMDEAA